MLLVVFGAPLYWPPFFKNVLALPLITANGRLPGPSEHRGKSTVLRRGSGIKDLVWKNGFRALAGLIGEIEGEAT
jgi:hypothetical protein